MKNKIFAILLTLILTIGLTTSISPGFFPSVSSQEEPKYGGTLIVHTPSDPAHFFGSGTSTPFVSIIAAPLYPALLTYDAKRDLEPVFSELATGFEFSDDRKTLTFNLRDNAKWTDGKPITSKDVKFTLEEITSKLHPHGVKFLQFLDVVETPDDHTAIIKLTDPYPPLPYFFQAHYCMIVPAHVWEPYVGKFVECPEYMEPKTTGGPFILKEFVRGDHITMERNPDYWNPAYLDTLIFKIIPDISSAIMALENGEVDSILPSVTPASEAKRLKDDPRFTVTTFGGFELRKPMLYLHFNLRNSPLDNKQVRQGLAYAIDRQAIVDQLLFGFAVVPDSPMPSTGMWAPYYKDAETIYRYDPAKANELLDAAGYPKGSDGKRGITLKYVTFHRDLEVKVGEMMASYFKDVGVEMTTVPLDQGGWVDMVFKQHDFDITTGDFGIAGDFSVEARVYHSDRANGYPWGNCMNYRNSRVDSLFDNVAGEVDETKRKEMFGEIQDTLADELPIFCLSLMAHPAVFSNDFGGLPAQPTWFVSYDTVWWKKGAEVAPGPMAGIGMGWIALAAIIVVVAIIAGVMMYKKSGKKK